jgi:hypothetical protein
LSVVTSKTHKSVVLIAAGLVWLATPQAHAAEPVKLSGAIVGLVTNSTGVPQMGASVLLLNHQERIFQKVLTDEKGEFRFLGLSPDLYSLRVTLASFIPAIRKDILVQPGIRSMLNVNLTTLFSSIQVLPAMADGGTLMTDDWKWMLRSAPATRPVLRFAADVPSSSQSSSRGSMFSDTRGVVMVSAGDGAAAVGTANEAPMGTAFAVATSLFGNNQLEVSGNLGYGSQTGVPVAAIRTAYSHAGGNVPDVSVTVRQLFLPGHAGGAAIGSEASLPMLRSVSASVDNQTQLADNINLQYGFTMDSVSFGDHLNYFSPYARLSFDLGEGSELAVAYTSGNARPDLEGHGAVESEFGHDLNTVGLFPRISTLGGRLNIQRGTELEATYSRKMGSRRVELSVYHERVTNAALSVAASSDFYDGGLLPDLFTGNAVLNAGEYHGSGYSAAFTQNVGKNLSATLMYGTMNALTASNEDLAAATSEDLRSAIHSARRQAATARIAAISPWTGTHVIASYQWTNDRRAVLPGRLYSTQAMRPLPGFNVYVRQPVPGLSILPMRVEAIADLRNLLAQGYLPLETSTGQEAILVQNPRSVRGGISFIF